MSDEKKLEEELERLKEANYGYRMFQQKVQSTLELKINALEQLDNLTRDEDKKFIITLMKAELLSVYHECFDRKTFQRFTTGYSY